MSASDKKKLRKEQEASLLTEKQLAAKKEAKKLKAYTVTFAVVMILVVCIAIGTIAYTNINKSGIFQKNTIAATINDYNLNNVELNYYYVDAISNNYTNMYNSYGDYTDTMLQYMGLDPSKSLSSQIYNADDGTTWADYFVNTAIENARNTYALYDAAMAEGFEMPASDKEALEQNIKQLQQYADIYTNGNINTYLSMLYGAGANLKSYQKYTDMATLASAYQTAYYNGLNYDNDAIRAYEEKVGYNNYTGYTYAYKFIDYSEFLKTKTDADGKTIEPTAEEIAAALEQSKQAAESLITATTVEEFDEMISALPIYAPADDKESSKTVSTKATDTLLTSALSSLQDWLADDAREAGDTAVLPYNMDPEDEDSNLDGYVAVFYQSKNENLQNLANVRHLLVSFECSSTEEHDHTSYTDEEKAAAKKTAEELLSTWHNGAATEESFIALVKEHSDDSTAEEGGLFENISPASNFVEPFLNWSIDPQRNPGDVEIVESTYGYHIMYYVGDSETTYRDSLIHADMKDADYDTWLAEKQADYVAQELNTKFINRDYIISPSY